MANEIMQTISRVRRAMPRNKDVMDICDALETEIVSEGLKVQAEMVKPRLTRAQIQKNYRDRRRAEGKAK
jgi:hypothetical protein